MSVPSLHSSIRFGVLRTRLAKPTLSQSYIIRSIALEESLLIQSYKSSGKKIALAIGLLNAVSNASHLKFIVLTPTLQTSDSFHTLLKNIGQYNDSLRLEALKPFECTDSPTSEELSAALFLVKTAQILVMTRSQCSVLCAHMSDSLNATFCLLDEEMSFQSDSELFALMKIFERFSNVPRIVLLTRNACSFRDFYRLFMQASGKFFRCDKGQEDHPCGSLVDRLESEENSEKIPTVTKKKPTFRKNIKPTTNVTREVQPRQTVTAQSQSGKVITSKTPKTNTKKSILDLLKQRKSEISVLITVPSADLGSKIKQLHRLITCLENEQMIVYANTKSNALRIRMELKKMNFTDFGRHSLGTDALDQFLSGELKVLIATDELVSDMRNVSISKTREIRKEILILNFGSAANRSVFMDRMRVLPFFPVVISFIATNGKKKPNAFLIELQRKCQMEISIDKCNLIFEKIRRKFKNVQSKENIKIDPIAQVTESFEKMRVTEQSEDQNKAQLVGELDELSGELEKLKNPMESLQNARIYAKMCQSVGYHKNLLESEGDVGRLIVQQLERIRDMFCKENV